MEVMKYKMCLFFNVFSQSGSNVERKANTLAHTYTHTQLIQQQQQQQIDRRNRLQCCIMKHH